MKSASLPLLGWRDFISLLGSAVAWPFAARAQQPEQMRRIGVLMNMAADDPQGQASIAAFHQGLQEWGWMLGRNARIDDTVTASALAQARLRGKPADASIQNDSGLPQGPAARFRDILSLR